MYRTTDPRFRRRLNDLSQTLESANETAQSGLYIFGQNYVRPCFSSIGQCFSGCVDASCPGRHRSGARGRGREVVNFDFYDDWDELEGGETDGLLGWGDEGGYGTVGAAEERRRGMSYGKARKSTDGGGDGVVTIPGGGHNGFWGKLFGGNRAVRYQPSAADLQDHPGQRRSATEGERLLGEDEDGVVRKHRRARSGTQASHETGSSYSSRGDLFPSDNEDDAVPLDDEFAMVLERRTTQSGGADTENSSNKTRGKRPSAGSRTSTRRTFSSRSSRSGKKGRSRTSSSAAQTVIDEASVAAMSEAVALKDEAFAREALSSSIVPEQPPSLTELKEQERALELEEEEAVERKRQEAIRAAAERGLTIPQSQTTSSETQEQPPQIGTAPQEEPSQLPTPLATDDEEDGAQAVNNETDESAKNVQGNNGSDS